MPRILQPNPSLVRARKLTASSGIDIQKNSWDTAGHCPTSNSYVCLVINQANECCMFDDIFFTSGQLRKRYGGCSHMWIERRLKGDADFPRPHYFGRLRFWKLSDLERYERKKAYVNHVEQ